VGIVSDVVVPTTSNYIAVTMTLDTGIA
jgi:hypothetical protein